jgi:hypothetical protein
LKYYQNDTKTPLNSLVLAQLLMALDHQVSRRRFSSWLIGEQTPINSLIVRNSEDVEDLFSRAKSRMDISNPSCDLSKEYRKINLLLKYCSL